MTKIDAVFEINQIVGLATTDTPLLLKQIYPASSSFEVGVGEIKVLKSHREVVLKIKEISQGVVVKIAILRNGVFFEEINLSNDSDVKLVIPVEKDDQLFFAYTHPVLAENARINFKLSLRKMSRC